MKDLKTVRKIIKKLDEVETLFQALSQKTKDELEREFEGGTKMYLINMQRNFNDLTKERGGK
ncbi:MAG TPA: hypothetical protein PLW37_11110 [bacterium]|jgi:hypothetical protein|nr:hypothetical protein [bacterium]HPM47204.1 hypothetical protein [bacterium]HQB10408.1 hypothetical protein [bacterium]